MKASADSSFILHPSALLVVSHRRGAITVAISDDGRTIAAGYGDSTIRIFEVK